MTYAEIVERLARYQEELSAESRLVRAGLKAKPELAAIQARYDDLFTQEHITEVKEALTAARNPRERERVERTMLALVEGRISAREMPFEESLLKTQLALTAEVDGERIGYHEFAGRLSREEDPARRERLRAAYVKLAAELAPQRLDLEQLTRQELAAFGFHSTREYAETKKLLNYEELLKKTIPILEETTGLYRRVMSETMRRAYGLELGEIPAAHVAHWRAGHEFDRLFPAESLVSSCRAAFAMMGLDLEAGGRIRLDAENRPQKNSRACCYPVKVPTEIYLMIKPRGGYEDVRTLMHEGGHALHFAYTDAGLPYEHRELPRSHALSEVFSFTMEQLTENPLWLEHALRVPKDISGRLSEWALLSNLFMLRRYVAKFTYELAFDAHPSDISRNRQTYAKTLRDLTGFVYEEDLYLEDMDPLFYSADYLRAWMASAQLEEHLTRTFGDRWFLRRETGDFLKSLYAKGVSWECEDLIRSLGMQPWDPRPLIRKFDVISRLLR